LMETHSLMELSPSWGAANCAATSRTSQHFMEPEGNKETNSEKRREGKLLLPTNLPTK
jgi:hypothetical protein